LTIDWGDGGGPLPVSNQQDPSHTYSDPNRSYFIKVSAVKSGRTYRDTMDVMTVSSPQQLEQKVLAAFEKVYNTIVYQPYAGLMKNPSAVEATQAGNDWDQAALLIQKIQQIDASL